MTGKTNLILTLWDVKNEYKAKHNKYSKELTDSEISIKTLYLLIWNLITIIIIIWIIEQGNKPRYSPLSGKSAARANKK